MFSVGGMEVRWSVIVKEHPNGNSVESRDNWHLSLPHPTLPAVLRQNLTRTPLFARRTHQLNTQFLDALWIRIRIALAGLADQGAGGFFVAAADIGHDLRVRGQ